MEFFLHLNTREGTFKSKGGFVKNNFRGKTQTTNLDKRKDFLKIQNECYICGKSLSTHVEYLPKTYRVVERVQCHNCMTLIRVKNHPVQ